jgi:hypothetical protein
MPVRTPAGTHHAFCTRQRAHGVADRAGLDVRADLLPRTLRSALVALTDFGALDARARFVQHQR